MTVNPDGPTPISLAHEGDGEDPRLGQRVGRYLLRRLLGRGGTGMVYEATHSDWGQRVAIKLLSVASPEAVAGLDGYEAVVVGSAIYMGHWLDDAKDFVATHATPLAALPVWLFSSGPLGEPGHLKPEEPPVDAAPMVEATGALDHRIFAGKLDKSKLKFTERAMAAAVKAPEGDFRDWDAIDGWAGEIAARLAGLAPG